MSRRRTLAVALTLAGVLLGSAKRTDGPRILDGKFFTDASPNAIVRELASPERRIPGAAEVFACETPGATKVIIHIRQAHMDFTSLEANTQGFEYGREYLERIGDVQRSIYAIGEHFARLGMREVYHEHLLPGMDPARQYRTALGWLYQGDLVARAGAPAAQEHARYIPGGARVLGLEGKVRILPFETARTYAAMRAATGEAMRAAFLGGDLFSEEDEQAAWHEIMHPMTEPREDAFLETAGARRATSAVVVLGGGHAFDGERSCGRQEYTQGQHRISTKDNLAAWNAAHPDRAFSLVEITPIGYDRL